MKTITDEKAAHFFAGVGISQLFFHGFCNAGLGELTSFLFSLACVFGFAICKEAGDSKFEFSDLVITIFGGILSFIGYKIFSAMCLLQIIVFSVASITASFFILKLKRK